MDRVYRPQATEVVLERNGTMERRAVLDPNDPTTIIITERISLGDSDVGEFLDFKQREFEDALNFVQRCSFCEKRSDEVRQLIAGPMVSICNECVDLCNEVLATSSK